MTSAAQNALLKVLEEPPHGVYIILITVSAEMMLTTIRSRAQLIQMEIFTQDKLREYVRELSPDAISLEKSDKDKLTGILLSSAGVIGKALCSLDEKSIKENEQRRRCVTDFISAFPKKASFAKLYAAAFAFPQKRDELKEALEDVTVAVRDLIVIRTGAEAQLLFFRSKDEAEGYSISGGIRRLMAIYELIRDAIRDLERNVLISSLLTDLAVKVKSAE
jgi:DNA polymerase-3 subunit delta'